MDNIGHTIASIIAGLLVVLTTGIAFWEGSTDHLAPLPPAPAVAPEIVANDPSQPGDHPFESWTYGSGTDFRRPEYNAAVRFRTQPVDASPFVDLDGWKAAFRSWYWGFDTDSFPLNGRVWAPVGDGPFPLVLIVHGNHLMREFSDPGYAYLAEHLASRGFIAVSIDENFLNMLDNENDARAWILLQHLALWRSWNNDPEHPLHGAVDMERIALIGHSRGGEAVATACAFNRLSRFPNDANVVFDFGFSIRAVAAIAPSDGQYRPGGHPTPLRDVDYLVLQGGHDSDVCLFLGARPYERVSFAEDAFHFKASVYMYRANHGQFNTVWGADDYPIPLSWLINHAPLISGEQQRAVTRLTVGAFLEAALHERTEFVEWFRDPNALRVAAGEDIYITRYEDSTFRSLADYEEDIDVTTTSIERGRIAGHGLDVWHETELHFRDPWNSEQENHAVYLGWTVGEEEADSDSPPVYEISFSPCAVPVGEGAEAIVLVFSIADCGAGNEPVDFTIEAVSASGQTASVVLSESIALPRPLAVRLTKLDLTEKRLISRAAEDVFQTIEVPLAAFVEANPGFPPGALTQIRFRFDRTEEGAVMIDRIGFCAAVQPDGQEEP